MLSLETVSSASTKCPVDVHVEVKYDFRIKPAYKHYAYNYCISFGMLNVIGAHSVWP